MALQTCNNNSTRIVSGIIGVTRQKSRCLVRYFKHEKDLYAAHLTERSVVPKNDSNKLNLLYEITLSAAMQSLTRRKTLLDFNKSMCNPFTLGNNF